MQQWEAAQVLWITCSAYWCFKYFHSQKKTYLLSVEILIYYGHTLNACKVLHSFIVLKWGRTSNCQAKNFFSYYCSRRPMIKYCKISWIIDVYAKPTSMKQSLSATKLQYISRLLVLTITLSFPRCSYHCSNYLSSLIHSG